MTFDEWWDESAMTYIARGATVSAASHRAAYEAGAASSAKSHDEHVRHLCARIDQLLFTAKNEGMLLERDGFGRNERAEKAERERDDVQAGYIELELARDAALARVKELEARLDGIWVLPALDWARVTFIVMQELATMARAGYQREAKTLVDALDKGKSYVTRMRDRAERAESERDAALAKVKELEAAAESRETTSFLGIRLAEAIVRAEKGEARVKELEADKAFLSGLGTQALRRAERAESERDAALAQVAACREELNKHHDSGCSSYGGYDCDCSLGALFASTAPKGKS